MYPFPYYQYQRGLVKNSNRIKQILLFFLITAFLFFIYILLTLPINTNNAEDFSGCILKADYYGYKSAMCNAMPILSESSNISCGKKCLTNIFFKKFLEIFMLDEHNPQAMLERELSISSNNSIPTSSKPVMNLKVPSTGSTVDSEPTTPSKTKSQPAAKPESEITPELTEDALVILYNTHTSETYALTDGLARLEGKRGGVVNAAAAMEEVLEKKYGIRVARSDAINDKVYSYSYARSQEVLKKLLKENHHVRAVFDIHRDAGRSREQSIVTIDGKKAAPLMIVVGSDARESFPNWGKNYSFAKKLKVEINKKYPGLCREIRVKDGRYNQFLHSRALLFEIGSVSNSTEEAVRSAELIGNVLGPMLLK